MNRARAVTAVVCMLAIWSGSAAAHDPLQAPIEPSTVGINVAFPEAPIVITVPYSTATSTPDGIARCVVELTVRGIRGSQFDATAVAKPTAGEATMTFFGSQVGTGFEPACDIFINDQASATVPQALPPDIRMQKYLFSLYVHSHPDQTSDPAGVCGIGVQAEGSLEITLQKRTGWLWRRLNTARIVTCEPIGFDDVPADQLGLR
jgi:hypothetical protein